MTFGSYFIYILISVKKVIDKTIFQYYANFITNKKYFNFIKNHHREKKRVNFLILNLIKEQKFLN